MEDISTNIKERVLYIAKYNGISYEKFFSKIGSSYGNFKGKAKETPLSSDTIAIILTKYPEVNPTWLIIGKGEMLRSENKSIEISKDTNNELINQLEKRISDKEEIITSLKDQIELLKQLKKTDAHPECDAASVAAI